MGEAKTTAALNSYLVFADGNLFVGVPKLSPNSQGDFFGVQTDRNLVSSLPKRKRLPVSFYVPGQRVAGDPLVLINWHE